MGMLHCAYPEECGQWEEANVLVDIVPNDPNQGNDEPKRLPSYLRLTGFIIGFCLTEAFTERGWRQAVSILVGVGGIGFYAWNLRRRRR